MSEFATGTYVKGDSAKVATSRAQAVALVFDGYVFRGESPSEDVDYRDLQAQAKELGIPANQSADALREQIDAELNKPGDVNVDPQSSENPLAPDLGGDSPLDTVND